MLRHFNVNTICNISKIPTILNINSKQILQPPINFYKYFHLPPTPTSHYYSRLESNCSSFSSILILLPVLKVGLSPSKKIFALFASLKVL